MEKRKCPFCYKEIEHKQANHIYNCNKVPENLSKYEIKFKHYQFNFPEISKKDILYNEYFINEKSLVEIKKEYGLDYKAINWLIDYHQIEKRSHKQGVLKGAQKTKQTLKQKYGVENISQLEEIHEKKRQTFLKNYGVDNIRKWKPFYDYVDKIIEEKYGMTKSEFTSKKAKELWESKTDEQKQEWLNNSIHSDEAIRKTLQNYKGYCVSKLETRIENILKENNITYTAQFPIKNKKTRKYYDFFIPDFQIIIEVNGNYWHANPEIYKPNDIINYCFGKRRAKDIWESDNFKKKLAESKGYAVIYIWEKELKQIKSNKKLLELIKLKLKEKYYEN